MVGIVKCSVQYLLVIAACLYYAEGRGRRCYTCRSRGELGDCKDPFGYNATTEIDVRGVEAVPCPSGWCGKFVEGGNGDFDTATERLCVQRPPVDNEERCSETVVNRRPVYMCFCLGDLCNGSNTSLKFYNAVISFIVTILTVLLRTIH